MHTLNVATGDGCTWSADILLGIFTTKDKAEEALLECADEAAKTSDFRGCGRVEFDDFFITEIPVDKICI